MVVQCDCGKDFKKSHKLLEHQRFGKCSVHNPPTPVLSGPRRHPTATPSPTPGPPAAAPTPAPPTSSPALPPTPPSTPTQPPTTATPPTPPASPATSVPALHSHSFHFPAPPVVPGRRWLFPPTPPPSPHFPAAPATPAPPPALDKVTTITTWGYSTFMLVKVSSHQQKYSTSIQLLHCYFCPDPSFDIILLGASLSPSLLRMLGFSATDAHTSARA